MAIKASNNRLLNCLAAIPTTKWLDKMLSKDIFLYKIDKNKI